jgi:hypothetical protein
MEMPQNWAEVNADPMMATSGGIFSVAPSPLLTYYRDSYKKATASGVPLDREAFRAALLFLIIQNLNPEALEAFHGREVAGTNGDGLLEFVDAWGKPIQFLRWAPAFQGSDIQSNARELHPDPTDERENAIGWFLFPLIYSAGPDGDYGINEGKDEAPTVGAGGILDPFDDPYITIGSPDGSGKHFDNIHNHQWYRSF